MDAIEKMDSDLQRQPEDEGDSGISAPLVLLVQLIIQFLGKAPMYDFQNSMKITRLIAALRTATASQITERLIEVLMTFLNEGYSYEYRQFKDYVMLGLRELSTQCTLEVVKRLCAQLTLYLRGSHSLSSWSSRTMNPVTTPMCTSSTAVDGPPVNADVVAQDLPRLSTSKSLVPRSESCTSTPTRVSETFWSISKRVDGRWSRGRDVGTGTFLTLTYCPTQQLEGYNLQFTLL